MLLFGHNHHRVSRDRRTSALRTRQIIGLRRHGGLLIAPVDNPVSLEVADIWARLHRRVAGYRRPRLDLVQRRIQLFPIVGEVERGVAGRRIDGGARAGRERILQHAFRRFARLRQIAEVQMDIVKQPHDEMPGDGLRGWPGGFGLGISISVGLNGGVRQSGRRLGLFNGKPRYFLQLAPVEELEIFLLQRADGMPLAIANHHGRQDQIYAGAEGEGRVALGHLGGGLRLLRGWSRTNQNRTAGAGQQHPQSPESHEQIL